MRLIKSHADQEKKLPSLPIIDIIDKWVHAQTRFHLADTDGYKEMLDGVARAAKQDTMNVLVQLRADYAQEWIGTDAVGNLKEHPVTYDYLISVALLKLAAQDGGSTA